MTKLKNIRHNRLSLSCCTWKTSHCSFYLSWPLAAVVRSKPSHASSLRPRCFSFCLWRGDMLRRDGEGSLAVFPSPRLDCAAAVCGPDSLSWGAVGLPHGSVSLPCANQVLPHYLADWLTRIPRLCAVRNGCDFWHEVWCFCLQHPDGWCSDAIRAALLLDLANRNISHRRDYFNSFGTLVHHGWAS